MSRQSVLVIAVALVVPVALWLALSSGDVGTIGDADIADESRTEDWLAYGRTHSEQRYSPLEDINRETIRDLGVAWFMDLPSDVGLVSTPLVVDGVMYFTGTMNVIRAVDATTGVLIWQYDPDVAGHIGTRRQVGWMHNRGISFYKGRIFAATWDGRLIALDAKSGIPVWSTRTFDANKPMYITGAPKAFKNKVLIGNGGTEVGRARGFVTAFDTDTGEELWKFHIVPGNPADGFENRAMAMAAETWTGNWWEHGGGGNAWHGITYDPDFNAVYIGTGNGSPWNRRIRSPGGGDNLFLSSIVALNADTGEYLWHYQTSPGETWDYTSTMDIVLADIEVDGRPVKAILHAPKNGFFYVIDRATGRLISARPFARVTWATHVDPASGKPAETPDARYSDGEAEIWPSAHGAHSWQAMSYSPKTGLVYLPTMELGGRYVDMGADISWRGVDFVGGTGVGLFEILVPEEGSPGKLQAWDPVRQQAAWVVPQEHPWNGGTLATGGNLVFQGRYDGMFLAYDATTGEELWSYDLGLGISAPPITYKLDGRQYVALLVGYGGGYTMGLTPGLPDEGWAYGVHTRRLVAFALNGNASLPPQPPPRRVVPLLHPDFPLVESKADQGGEIYGTYCAICHGGGAVANAMAPDLRASAVPLDVAAFAEVVRAGARVNRGMPPFADFTDEDLDALRHYIRAVAHRDDAVFDEVASPLAPRVHAGAKDHDLATHGAAPAGRHFQTSRPAAAAERRILEARIRAVGITTAGRESRKVVAAAAGAAAADQLRLLAERVPAGQQRRGGKDVDDMCFFRNADCAPGRPWPRPPDGSVVLAAEAGNRVATGNGGCGCRIQTQEAGGVVGRLVGNGGLFSAAYDQQRSVLRVGFDLCDQIACRRTGK